MKFNAVDLAGLDQRCDATPGDAALVVTGKECVLAVQGRFVVSSSFIPVRAGEHAKADRLAANRLARILFADREPLK